VGELASECGVRANIGDCEAVDSAAFGEPRIGVPATSGDRRKGDAFGEPRIGVPATSGDRRKGDPPGTRAAGVVGDGAEDGAR